MAKAIKINEKNGDAYCNLGVIFLTTGDVDNAVVHFQKAVQYKPNDSINQYNLGYALFESGDFSEATNHLKFVLKLLPSKHFRHKLAVERLKDCRKWSMLDNKLSSIQKGNAKPKHADEQLELAILCRQFKRLNQRAVAFYTNAFAEKPALAEDVQLGHRYNAACAAALAAAGKGRDSGLPTKTQRSKLRLQSLNWLRAELRAWKKLLQMKQSIAVTLRERLKHWQSDPDLASVRVTKPLAMLSEAERNKWQKVWIDVKALRKSAGLCYGETTLKGSLTADDIEEFHRLGLSNGKTYIIDMVSTDFDAYLRLQDDQGKILAKDDDSGPGLNSRIKIAPKQSADYILIASSFDRRGRGDYVIIIREIR